MIDLKDFEYRESWGKVGKYFVVEVVKRKNSYNNGFSWNIYCYLYPKHKLFKKAKTDSIFDCPIESFHGGCTYSLWYRDRYGNIISKQYGCDYNHLGDEKFASYENPSDAIEVFNDVGILFFELSEFQKGGLK